MRANQIGEPLPEQNSRAIGSVAEEPPRGQSQNGPPAVDRLIGNGSRVLTVDPSGRAPAERAVRAESGRFDVYRDNALINVQIRNPKTEAMEEHLGAGHCGHPANDATAGEVRHDILTNTRHQLCGRARIACRLPEYGFEIGVKLDHDYVEKCSFIPFASAKGTVYHFSHSMTASGAPLDLLATSFW